MHRFAANDIKSTPTETVPHSPHPQKTKPNVGFGDRQGNSQ